MKSGVLEIEKIVLMQDIGHCQIPHSILEYSQELFAYMGRIKCDRSRKGDLSRKSSFVAI